MISYTTRPDILVFAVSAKFRARSLFERVRKLSTMGYVRFVAGTVATFIENYLTAESFTAH